MIKTLFTALSLVVLCLSSGNATENIFDSIVENNTTIIGDNTQSPQNTKQFVTLLVKKVPTKIYKNQRFSISFEAIVSDDNFEEIQTEFLGHENLEIINKENHWIDKKKLTYSNTFHFIARNEEFVMPNIIFKTLLEGNVVGSAEIAISKPSFYDIGNRPQMFSNIICDELKIISAKSKYFDQKNTITVLEIETKNGNLEDFYLKNTVDQGLESFKEDTISDTLTYFVVTPNYQKTIEFDYFNSKENLYKKIIIPIVMVDDIVSTQTDLNPKDSTFYFYKIYLYILLTLAFIVYFVIKKSKIALYLSILPLYLLYDLTLNNDSCIVKKNANIYILPTKNSTVFRVLEEELKVEIINSNKDFVKVVFPNKQIGWVKKNDIK